MYTTSRSLVALKGRRIYTYMYIYILNYTHHVRIYEICLLCLLAVLACCTCLLLLCFAYFAVLTLLCFAHPWTCWLDFSCHGAPDLNPLDRFQLPLDSRLEALVTSWWPLVPLGKALAAQGMPE